MNREIFSSSVQGGKRFHIDHGFWDSPLPCGMVELYQLGELCCEHGFQIEAHEQKVYEIIYVISGSGSSTIAGETVFLKEGSLLVNSVGHVHSMAAGETDLFRYAYLGFLFRSSAEEPELQALQRCYKYQPYYLIPDQNNIIYPFLQSIGELYSSDLLNLQMVKNYCEQLVILTARNLLRQNGETSEKLLGRMSSTHGVYDVIRYVEENVCTLRQVVEVASALGYGYSYLSHFFKERTGISLQKYISYKKAEYAARLLKCSGLSVTEISVRLCYESPQAFSKAFKRVMGISPSLYVGKGSQ